MFAGKLILAIVTMALVACSSEEENTLSSVELPLPVLSDSKIKALSGQAFYFGHQSVGYNIVEGVERILDRMGKPGLFSVRELASDQDAVTPGLLHSRVGRNGEPLSKMEDFQRYILGGMGEKLDVAMLKFCYVDIGKETDIIHMMDEYSKTIDSLRRDYPGILFVYTTVPLREFGNSWKAKLKRLLGMDVWGDQANIKRNEFNADIRKKYSGTGRLADVAGWESRYPDNRKFEMELFGKTYESLIPEYTNDGSHLNEYGQIIVAGRLIEFLAGLVEGE